MARQTIIQLTDDIDGTPASNTITFGLDGVTYEIDLNDKNNNALRTSLNPYLESARRVRSGSGGSRQTRRTSDKQDTKDRNTSIRTWALNSGVELPSRGRIAGAVHDAYDAQDVTALFAAVGLEMEKEPKPRRGRTRAVDFSTGE